MMASARRPRLDQVAELTRRIRLPLPAIKDTHLQVLAEGLQEAFDDLCERRPVTMATGNEPEVTTLLQTRLNGLCEEDSLWGRLVRSVARGAENISFDGSHLEKRPDLSISLYGQPRDFPLVVEAKILDGTSSRTVASYCGDRGLLRFVKGEYAWASSEAFMLAYVRDGSSIDSKLKPRLAHAMALNPARHLVEDLPIHVGSGAGLGVYAAWTEVHLPWPSTTKQAGIDFRVAFVAEVGRRDGED